MTKRTKPADLYVRLPENKKHLKKTLVEIAARNNMTISSLMVVMIEWFLEAKKDKEFSFKLK